MKKQISHISLHQTSLTMAVWYFIIALLFAIPMGLYGLYRHEEAAWAWFLIPFFYLVLTYLLSAILFWLYNIVAKYVGGIEFNLNDVE